MLSLSPNHHNGLTQNHKEVECDDPLSQVEFDPSSVPSLQNIQLSQNTFNKNFDQIRQVIKDYNKQTFNPMDDQTLNEIISALNGPDNISKSLALVELADHLITFNNYEFAFLAYNECVSLCIKLSKINQTSQLKRILHDGLLGIAKILMSGKLNSQISNCEEVSAQILNFLGTVFNSNEAMLFL